MSQIIDRRLNGRNKSAVNRQRFLNRFKKQIKNVVDITINKRSITNIETGEKIIIPAKDTKEPIFGHGKSGVHERVFPGNKEFCKGDRIHRPQSSSNKNIGNAGTDSGGIDDFVFEISKSEFLNIFFDDLALPDLVKKQLAITPTIKTIRAGFTLSGIPTNINIVRSFKSALSRKIALASPYKNQLRKIEEELKELLKNHHEDEKIVKDKRNEISFCRTKIKAIPFIDPFDLRYNNKIKQQIPSTNAVMFCLMDVSGSMDKIKKDIAKRFFILLYLFLTRCYEKLDIVFIRHHTFAKEVNEEEFFFSRETGGTVVSSALKLMQQIIDERYNKDAWNIYAAQASDGDNWNADSPFCGKLLLENIMPYLQYFAYVEIMPRLHQSLWESYLNIKETHPNFVMQTISNSSEIYTVFRQLFTKQK